jgi:hypothetical protein
LQAAWDFGLRKRHVRFSSRVNKMRLNISHVVSLAANRHAFTDR